MAGVGRRTQRREGTEQGSQGASRGEGAAGGDSLSCGFTGSCGFVSTTGAGDLRSGTPSWPVEFWDQLGV